MLILEARVRGHVVRWPLREGDVAVVGRASECGVVVEDDSISRQHCRIEVDHDRAVIEDLESRNGLWFGGQRQRRIEVGLDEIFAAGAVLFALRRGITLNSESAWRDPHETRDSDAAVEGEAPGFASPRDTPPLEDPLEWVSRTLDGAGDSTLERLLRLLVEAEGLRGAGVVAGSGNGVLVEAWWGEPARFDDLDGGSAPPSHHALHDALLHAAPLHGTPLHDATGTRRQLVVVPAAEIASPTGRLLRSLIAFTTRRVDHAPEPVQASGAPPADTSGTTFITASERCTQTLAQLDRLAASPLPILISGESGTGKELLARRVHARSPRAPGPFVAINCAAVPDELLEAELFGIERGVATGVNARPGLFALACGGTLFLDEIGDLPAALQPKLLRVLEGGEVTPLGARAPLPVDVRIVTATNTEPGDVERPHGLRRDLYYRIAGAVVTVPPLRERPEDVLPIAREVARAAAHAQGRAFRGIDAEAARVLVGHAWPGNVRELRHAVTRAIALADGPVLHRALLPPEIGGADGARGGAGYDERRGAAYSGLNDEWAPAKERFERLYFGALLERCKGNINEAARHSGLSRSRLYAKLAELGLR